MPMSFQNMESLKARATQRKFRQPIENESEADYRTAFANFMVSVDMIESMEIRSSKGWVNGDDHSDKDFTDSWNGEASEDAECDGEKEDLPKLEFRISYRKRPNGFVIFIYRIDEMDDYVVFASTIHCFWHAGTFIIQKEYHNMDKLGCIQKEGV